jgi:hypothetical protein
MIDMEHPDETDLTREDLMAMWEEGEPVEIIDGPVTIDPSPWLLSRTGRRYVGQSPVVRRQSTAFALRLSGAATS